MRATYLFVVLFGATQAAEVVSVPGGHLVTKECIVEVPNGKLYDVDKHEMPANCKVELGIQIYAADVHMKSEEPLTSFYADWTVPALPTEKGFFSSQVVYFWPGFKAKQPEMGLPVLQPVLQYGEQKKSWMLQSWFVDGSDRSYPVVTAPAIDVSPGDAITSYMNRSADGKTWTVSGTCTRTGKDSTLHVAFAKAGNTEYDYAMLVNENINVNKECARMPAGDDDGKGTVTFTNVKVNGKVPQWTTRTNCKGNTKCDCDNSAVVSGTGDVTLGWNSGKSAHDEVTV